jgi:hypothetical protein
MEKAYTKSFLLYDSDVLIATSVTKNWTESQFKVLFYKALVTKEIMYDFKS